MNATTAGVGTAHLQNVATFAAIITTFVASVPAFAAIIAMFAAIIATLATIIAMTVGAGTPLATTQPSKAWIARGPTAIAA